MIIDDEKLAIDRLQRLLEPFEKDIEIIGIATDGRSAVQKINDLKPDLIFLDIQMPELTGFEVATQVSHHPWIIFSTAYDEYALKAFETNSIDYLLKPIDKKRLEIAIQKAKQIIEKPSESSSIQLHEILKKLGKPDGFLDQKLVIKVGDKIRYVDYADIIYFGAKDKVIEVHTATEIHVMEASLLQLEEDLKSQQFIRVHRSFLINSRFIKEVVRWFGGKFIVKMKDQKKSEIPISSSYKDRLGL